MKVRFTLAAIAFALLTSVFTTAVMADELPRRTALDDYIDKPDDSYSWKVVRSQTVDGMKLIVVDMVSQTWRTKKDVNRQ